MKRIVFKKLLFGLAAFMALASCTDEDRTATFRGEPLIAGSDPDAVVLAIDDARYPSILLSQDNGEVSIGVFQAKTGAPALTMLDSDNDGVFDLLTYSALSKSGETLVDVEDYGMDGQPDLILNHQNSSAVVFVNGKWHDVDGVGTEQVTVLINSERRALKDVVPGLGRKQ